MMTPGKNYVGSPLQLSINLQTTAGVDTDPTTLTFTTQNPYGARVTYTYGTDAEITKSSTGDYDVIFSPDVPGRWHYQWVTTGTAIVEQGDFLIQASVFYDDAFDAYGWR